jgi:hypothetical protein
MIGYINPVLNMDHQQKYMAVESALDRIIKATPGWEEHRDLIMKTTLVQEEKHSDPVVSESVEAVQKRKFNLYRKIIEKIF